MAAFMPGASPPLVKTPMRFISFNLIVMVSASQSRLGLGAQDASRACVLCPWRPSASPPRTGGAGGGAYSFGNRYVIYYVCDEPARLTQPARAPWAPRLPRPAMAVSALPVERAQHTAGGGAARTLAAR